MHRVVALVGIISTLRLSKTTTRCTYTLPYSFILNNFYLMLCMLFGFIYLFILIWMWFDREYISS